MNERVRELRKALNLTMEKFGDQLGVKKTAISRIESSINNLTDQMIKLICLTYSVNEDWLRTGNGSMFVETQASFLTELQKKYDLTDLQVTIIQRYLDLPKEDKASIDKFISSLH